MQGSKQILNNSIYFTKNISFSRNLLFIISTFSHLLILKKFSGAKLKLLTNSFQANPAILCLNQNLVKVIGPKDFDRNLLLLFLVNQV